MSSKNFISDLICIVSVPPTLIGNITVVGPTNTQSVFTTAQGKFTTSSRLKNSDAWRKDQLTPFLWAGHMALMQITIALAATYTSEWRNACSRTATVTRNASTWRFNFSWIYSYALSLEIRDIANFLYRSYNQRYAPRNHYPGCLSQCEFFCNDCIPVAFTGFPYTPPPRRNTGCSYCYWHFVSQVILHQREL